ncbi:MAG: hypothetical protein OEZ01_09725 [Candidatus Heimdallarchaeota archaeon]|nr:hypothetical protein [Candidatus Heimdallarchaeota archaeon]MDH5646276.1 hypothetical protein [Candidatus Heimdallarchaeota archaeon]
MTDYANLLETSLILIGDRYNNKVNWLQLYDASDSYDEMNRRQLLLAIKKHIIGEKITSGSARKFQDGKLIYYETSSLQHMDQPNVVYCLYTKELQIKKEVKDVIEAVARRGGVYSASRYYSEIVDLLLHPEKIRESGNLSISEALQRIDNYDPKDMDLNELGFLIALIEQNTELDQFTLEKIYYHVFESIDILEGIIANKESVEDIDEFIDAAYLVAQRYEVTQHFHLALELYKKIIPLSNIFHRLNLEIACRLNIATIYKNFFHEFVSPISEILEPINSEMLKQISDKDKEKYYFLLGYVDFIYVDYENAKKNFQKSIDIAKSEIKSPEIISMAYNYQGRIYEHEHKYLIASKFYHTAGTISFVSGYIQSSEKYLNNASKTLFKTSYSLIHSALWLRMNNDDKNAVFQTWEAVKFLLRAYQEILVNEIYLFEERTKEIIELAKVILEINEKEKYVTVINKIEEFIEEIQNQSINPETIENDFEQLHTIINENIPLEPPTLLVLTTDGRLILQGVIGKDGWEESELEGSLLSGVISAILTIIAEVSSGNTALRTVDAGDFQIMIEESEHVITVFLVDRELPEFRNILRELIDIINSEFSEKLADWMGNMDIFEKLIEKAVELISYEKLISIYNN